MTTVFTLAGAFGNPALVPEYLGGTITDGNNIHPILYPNWGISDWEVEVGGDMLEDAINNTPGEKIGFGHSWGAVVICNWLNRYGRTSSVPASDLSFVCLGNSVRPYGGLCNYLDMYQSSRAPDNTPYTVQDFVRQYDGFADAPDDFGNGLADSNMCAGFSNIHTYYRDVRLDDPGIVTHQVGNISYMWEMSYPVPLLGRDDNGALLSWDSWLRPQIEQAYNRPVTIPTPNYGGS